jgi:hypothetical protein
MLEESKAGVDTTVQAAKDEFAALVETEINESAAAAQEVKNAYSAATSDAQAAQADLMATSEAKLAQDNQTRKDNLQALTDARLDAINDACDVRMGKVEKWIKDRLEWAKQIPDTYYKKHIMNQLNERMSKISDTVQAQRDQAATDAAEANQTLWDNLDAEAQNLADYNVDQTTGLNGFVLATKVGVSIAANGIDDAFGAQADAQNDLLIEAMDKMTKDWAYWLKYFYGF